MLTHRMQCATEPINCPFEGCKKAKFLNSACLEQHLLNECNYSPGFCDQCGVKMTKDTIKTHDCIVNFKTILFGLKERGKLSSDDTNFNLIFNE